jgi:hypothetical protein
MFVPASAEEVLDGQGGCRCRDEHRFAESEDEDAVDSVADACGEAKTWHGRTSAGD